MRLSNWRWVVAFIAIFAISGCSDDDKGNKDESVDSAVADTAGTDETSTSGDAGGDGTSGDGGGTGTVEVTYTVDTSGVTCGTDAADDCSGALAYSLLGTPFDVEDLILPWKLAPADLKTGEYVATMENVPAGTVYPAGALFEIQPALDAGTGDLMASDEVYGTPITVVAGQTTKFAVPLSVRLP